MSNPLRLIRRYQKRLMVFFGVLLMLAFIVGGALTTATRPDRGRNEATKEVVSWAGGKLKRRELDYLKLEHQFAQFFLQQIAQQAIEAKGQPQVNIRLREVSNDPTQGDRDMLTILMLARKARQLGMVMSDEAVMQFLAQACDGELTEMDYEVLLDEMTNRQTSLMSIREHLKTELLAVQMESLLVSGFIAGPQPIITPVQAYDFDARQYRTVRCQLVPFDVENFIDQVSDEPSRSEIRDLYNRGKYQFPDPQGKRPGFRKPRQLGVAWVKPNLNALRPAPGTITEEEIQTRYQQWEDDPSSPAWQIGPAGGSTPAIPGLPGSSPTGATPNPGSETPTTPLVPPNNGDGAATGDAGTSDAGNPPAGGDAGTGDAGTGDAGTGDSGTSGSDTSGGGNSNQSRRTGPTRAVDADRLHYVSTSTPIRQDGMRVAVPDGNARPPRPAISKPATTPPSGDEQTPANQDPTEGAQKPQLLPLDEVRQQIISELQQEKAEARAWELVKQLEREYLEPASNAFLDWEIAKEENEEAARPDAPSVKDFAEQNGLTYGSTEGLVPLREFSETELGQYEIFNMQYFQQFRTFPPLSLLLEAQFDSLGMYVPERLPDFAEEGERPVEYVYWITDKKQPYSPEFEEARDEVVRFWKMQRAQDLARAAAQELVEFANGSDATFRDNPEFAGEVLVTDAFPWRSSGGGNLPMGGGQLEVADIRVSRAATEGEPEGGEVDAGFLIEDIGDDFMSGVFSIATGNADVVFNTDQTKAYAVYVLEEGGMTPELLQEQVIRRRVIDPQARTLAATELNQYFSERMRELEEDMNVEWLD